MGPGNQTIFGFIGNVSNKDKLQVTCFKCLNDTKYPWRPPKLCSGDFFGSMPFQRNLNPRLTPGTEGSQPPKAT